MQPDLSPLLPLIADMPAYRRLARELDQSAETSAAVLSAARPYLIAALYHTRRQPVLVVTAQPEGSRKLHEQLKNWCPTAPAKLLPEPDSLPYERAAADKSVELEQIEVLAALAGQNGAAAGPPLVVASVPAIMARVAPHGDFTATGHTIEPGTDIEPLELMERWQAMGYQVESLVEIPGTTSRRGGIVDIYPPTSHLPARIEFLGNTIESIRLFDPVSQRSQSQVPSITIVPATEFLAPRQHRRAELETVVSALDLTGVNPETGGQIKEGLAALLDKQIPDNAWLFAPLFNTDSLLSYLPGDALIILDEPASIRAATETLDAQAEELRAEQVTQGELPRNFPRPYLNWTELEPGIKERRCLQITSLGVTEKTGHRLNFTPATGYAGQLPVFTRKIKQLLDKKRRLIIISHQASRLSELLDSEDIIAPPLAELAIPLPGSLSLVQGSLAEGWVMDNDTHLFTDAEIFGFAKQPRPIKKRPVSHHQLYNDITPGDYVVHVEHGIAEFASITTMGGDSRKKEYLVLLYADGDKLYVPTDQIDRVGRYLGASELPPKLSRLGTQEWSRAKQRVQESVADIAQELLALYASREVVPGFAFSPDTVWQHELELSFPYAETPDQLEVVRQVKEDMNKLKPMDRLVSGDVGYGKTEVAIRAAFKAVMDGKQVAVLVPTTVLAEQHFATFRQRLEAFPVRVDVLSRFKAPRDEQAVLDGLASGSVDICIGTHRLLQQDVSFKDLGLLVIDEEQRFGVTHKEHLKKMRQEVDVLTLSATPIPRTLHMSLVGVRDMSTIETPPEERLPIKTYVAEYNERLIREAVLRELERNGQIFFVHNRVQGIAHIAAKLQSLAPEARIATAHGQMPGVELERVMAGFTRGDSDILVCTTIIESGLDMPNVNTLIVNRADRFGLTDLYQLRGRVGRGANLAYAYFLYEKGRHLTPTAERRLRTIFETTELGAGFNIALKDLEIRGAGTLLGARQSGHISAVGFNLYTRLLADAVGEQKARQAGAVPARPSPLPEPTVDLPLKAYIPADYVPDLGTRLGLYQKLVTLDRIEPIAALAQEFTDRFGILPAEVANLLYAVKIKVMAARAGIESITTEAGQITIRLFPGMQFDREKLEPFLRDGIRPGSNQLHLNPKRLGAEWRAVLEEILKKVGCHKYSH